MINKAFKHIRKLNTMQWVIGLFLFSIYFLNHDVIVYMPDNSEQK